ncbi:hypothetical protein M8J75_016338 [Diaphorina citri]|nr:hypothetical protein M8J75_016338 [Diaphorina citri]
MLSSGSCVPSHVPQPFVLTDCAPQPISVPLSDPIPLSIVPPAMPLVPQSQSPPLTTSQTSQIAPAQTSQPGKKKVTFAPPGHKAKPHALRDASYVICSPMNQSQSILRPKTSSSLLSKPAHSSSKPVTLQLQRGLAKSQSLNINVSENVIPVPTKEDDWKENR